jgi:hypothetical protein
MNKIEQYKNNTINNKVYVFTISIERKRNITLILTDIIIRQLHAIHNLRIII